MGYLEERETRLESSEDSLEILCADKANTLLSLGCARLNKGWVVEVTERRLSELGVSGRGCLMM